MQFSSEFTEMEDTRISDYNVALDYTLSISLLNSRFPYNYISVYIDEYRYISSTFWPTVVFPEVCLDSKAFPCTIYYIDEAFPESAHR